MASIRYNQPENFLHVGAAWQIQKSCPVSREFAAHETSRSHRLARLPSVMG